MATCAKEPVKSKAPEKVEDVRYQDIPLNGPTKIRPIVSDDGLAEATEVLRRVAYEASVISSQLLAETLALSNRAKSATLKVTGEKGATVTVGLADYAAKLLAEITDYGHRMEAETVACESGKVARRMNQDRVAFIPRLPDDADDDATATEKTGEKASQSLAWKLVSGAIHAALKKCGLDRFWKCELKPDISTAKAALSRGEITEDQLAKQGMQLVKGERRIDVSVEGSDLKKVREFLGI